MLACDQESGSVPVSSDFWKIICGAGANSLAVSGRILAGISSGPVALFGFSPCNSLATRHLKTHLFKAAFSVYL